MRQLLNRLLLNKCFFLPYNDSKRFAGHSKWANIKHIKQEKDNEKMLLFHHYKMQIMIAVREGGSTKPEQNLRLSQLIEQAKKSNMPVASIKSYLEKMETRQNKIQEGMIEIRGPSGYAMLVRYNTDHVKKFQMDLNNRLKKCSGKVTNSSVRNMFNHIGNIIVEKKGDLDQAMEDAINVGAEDVEEFEENDTKYFLFRCEPQFLRKIKKLLENRQYCVLSAEEDYVPHNLIKLNESDLEVISRIRERVLLLEDVSHIHDNAA